MTNRDTLKFTAHNGSDVAADFVFAHPSLLESPAVDDSQMTLYVHGLGESIDTVAAATQRLADASGAPAAGFAVEIGPHVRNAQNDVVPLYAEAMAQAVARSELFSANVERWRVVGHSVAGITMGGYLAENPDRFDTVVFHKTVGLNGAPEGEETGNIVDVGEQMAGMNPKIIAREGRAMARRYLGPGQFFASLQFLRTDRAEAVDIAKTGMRELMNGVRYGSPSNLLACFGVAEAIDLRALRRSLVANDKDVLVVDSLGHDDKVIDFAAAKAAQEPGETHHDVIVHASGHIPVSSKQGLDELATVVERTTSAA